jgi:hypothetical protein
MGMAGGSAACGFAADRVAAVSVPRPAGSAISGVVHQAINASTSNFAAVRSGATTSAFRSATMLSMRPLERFSKASDSQRYRGR